MNTGRRSIILSGGGLLVLGLGHALGPRTAGAADIVDIAMMGSSGGAHVWFKPTGLLVHAGQTIRWTNRDPGNSHTATAYHPSLYQKPQRIPDGATPWDSGFLLPNESFSVTLTVPGVYDYYCLPHELAGMVGRIIVDQPASGGWLTRPGADTGVSDAARKAFPAIDRIMQEKIVQ